MRINMLYEFRCNECNTNTEIFFTSHNEYHIPSCVVCNNKLTRVYTAPALRCNGIRKTQPGLIEMGNDYPSVEKKDESYDTLDKEINEYINNNSEMELSRL